MKLGKASGKNYGSYATIDFDYSDLGLALLSGQTKAGKSTLLDFSTWIIFGVTSKDLNVDDVKSWFSETETSGTIEITLPGKTINVTRIRGKRPSQNDLFYTVNRGVEDLTQVRGKDTNDTQRMLNQELGVDADLYVAASYIHQFSSDKFFTAKAKDRRDTMERIADLSIAIKLGAKSSELRKEAKRDLEFKYQNKSNLDGKLEILKATLEDQLKRADLWLEQQKIDIENLKHKRDNFSEEKEQKVFKIVDQLEQLDRLIAPTETFEKRLEQVKEQIRNLENVENDYKAIEFEYNALRMSLIQKQNEFNKYNKDLGAQCPVCLGPANNSDKEEHLNILSQEIESLSGKLKSEQKRVDDFSRAISIKPKLHDSYQKITKEAAENIRLIDKFESLQAQALALREETNPYLGQLEQVMSQTNPYHAQMSNTDKKIQILSDELHTCVNEIAGLEHKVSSLTWLYDKSYELRGLLLNKSVKQINDVTNSILERFFDAAIRVKFELDNSDKLEVLITNEGYDCKYAQLSGGERAMLKLAFSVGYMKAAENTAGIKFETLMIDEGMNGLDATLKLRAFALLQSLQESYSSILLIDHEESFKQMFSKVFYVEKTGAYSEVYEDSI